MIQTVKKWVEDSVPNYEAVEKQWEDAAPHWKAVIKQLAVPAGLAAAYGLWDWWINSTENFSFSEYIKVTLPALFFLMWFVSLYERAKKRSTDSESFNSIDSKIDSLHDSIKKLSSAHMKEPKPYAAENKITFSQQLMLEAEKVFQAGHNLAALLQAGVAFEQSVRSFAKSKGLSEADRMPLLQIFQKIDFLLPNKDVVVQLNMLRQIRNQLAHASEGELHRIDQAEKVLRTYRWAVDTLESEAGIT